MKLRRLIGFHLGTGLVFGVVCWYLGWYLGHQISYPSVDYFSDIDQNDLAIFLGYLFGTVGFLAGLGFLNYPLARLTGRSASLPGTGGPRRYFGMATDHKVVGLQYLWGIGLFFFIGGLNAMLIRFELLSPNRQIIPAGQYLTVVGLHGTMMMGIMSSAILGPFANYFVPIMIGARRMAFPRLEALSFWLLMAGGAILTTTIFFGGFPTGWTGYAPLLDEANGGIDSYIVFFSLVGISMCVLGLNLIVTVITMRGPGLTWFRLPIFVWGVLSTAVLMLLASPVLVAVLGMGALDRTAQTTFFIPSRGGSQYLYENLFWVFGHPEVYILALPGFGIILELIPVFARKPLWGYRLAVSGMLGVALLSWLVWQHHLFVSGINSDSRPFYMFSTELISVPTGFTFLCGLMTLWRGRIRLAVPMLFCLAWFFNFLIGGLSGIFLSDVPSDTTLHGSFFSMAHFHYTIMGGLVFAFFAAIYFWVPKMTGWAFNDRLAKIHFWSMFIAFNSTFAPLFAIGYLGQSRRAVTYPTNLQFLNDWASISAFVLGISMLVFLFNLVWSLGFRRVPAGSNPWESRSIEWQLPSPVPPGNFTTQPVFSGDLYAYGSGEPVGLPGAAARDRVMSDVAMGGTYEEPPELLGRNLTVAGQLVSGATAFFFLAFVFAYVYLRSVDKASLWHPHGVKAPVGYGTAIVVLLVASAIAVWLARTGVGGRVLCLAAGLGLGIAALAVQVAEWLTIGFGPADGGYASVFVGWTGFYAAFVLLALVWVEIQLATTLRNRAAEPVGLDAASFYLSFVAGIGVLTWIVLYLA